MFEYRWDIPVEAQLANMIAGEIAPLLYKLRIMVNFVHDELQDEDMLQLIEKYKTSDEPLAGFSVQQWEEWKQLFAELAEVLRQRPEKKTTKRLEGVVAKEKAVNSIKK